MGLTSALAALIVLLVIGGAAPADLQGLALALLVALGLEVVAGLATLIRRWSRGPAQPPRAERQTEGVVDGSNVMHWNGAPSALVLTRVVAALTARGERPHVYFDANVGYKLQDRFMDATAMAFMLDLSPARVTLADRGNPADPLLLDYAIRLGVRVLSNDRFRDWRDAYPQIGTRGFLVRGRWQQGTVILDLPHAPARAA
jgi:Zc3h12a-like Ribonuclease NYN domain